MRYKYSKLYWFLRGFGWMEIYFSPFKPILPKLYVGKIAIGCPWFFPRRFVKATPERAHKATKEYIKKEENYNKMNPNYARTIKPYDEIFKEKMKCSFSEPKIVGFDFVSLGWKTKWDDYRHEWNPMWSFVFFKWQIALMFIPENDMHYLECWLYYSKETDKSKSREERIKQAREIYSCQWSTHINEVEEKICYWDVILRKKYLK